MEFAIIQLLVFLLLASVDIGTAVYDRYWRHLDQNIGYVAHLAGAVAGRYSLFVIACQTKFVFFFCNFGCLSAEALAQHGL